MDILFAAGEASVNQIRGQLVNPPAHTAIRTHLHILEQKGCLRREKRGREFFYRPRQARQQAGQSALRRVIQTFFEGSLEKALGAHLTDRNSSLSEVELKRAVRLINEARKKGD